MYNQFGFARSLNPISWIYVELQTLVEFGRIRCYVVVVDLDTVSFVERTVVNIACKACT